jgi:replicative DNA helicase
MGLGLRLLRSLIDSDDVANIQLLREALFNDTEKPAFNFVRAHFSRYGSLPRIETCEENGHPLTRNSESFEYNLNRATSRAQHNMFNAVQQEHARLHAARDPQGLKELYQGVLANLATVEQRDTYTTLQAEAEAIRANYEVVKHAGVETGVTLGWPTLDEISLGAQGGDIIVLVARPGMGKSYSLVKMASEAWKAGHSILFVSMEMTVEQISRRWLGVESGINPNMVREGKLSRWGEDILFSTIDDIEGKAPVTFLCGNFRKTVEDVTEAAQRFDPDIIYVDAAYLLGVRNSGSGNKARWEKTTEVIEGLKALAQNLNKPIAITVQFNRDVKKKNKKDLDLGSIAGADSIPQIASLVLGIQGGIEPNQTTQRRYTVMKHREGEDEISFSTNYLFEPINFDEVEAESESEPLNTDWMV